MKRRLSPSLLSLLFLFAPLGACSSVDVLVRQGPPSKIGDHRIAVAPPVIQADLIPATSAAAPVPAPVPVVAPEETEEKTEVSFGGAPSPVDPVFEAGLYVGHLHMAGGYVVVEAERGMQHRSKIIEAHEQERYRKLASDWLKETIEQALTWKRIPFVAVEALSPEVTPLPERREVRGSGPLDLRDNQNLPRFDQNPGTLSESMIAALPDLQGAPLLLVPFVTTYYSHNGGWFVGQTYGTGAGARIRIMWVLYDVSSSGKGRVLRWGEIQARHVESHVNSPNSTQIDDFLLGIEKVMAKELRRRLLR